VFEGEATVTTHAGPFVTLPAAYAIFPRVIQLPKHQLIGLPALEHQTARVNARLQLNVTAFVCPW
jgi:hypothetical protein